MNSICEIVFCDRHENSFPICDSFDPNTAKKNLSLIMGKGRWVKEKGIFLDRAFFGNVFCRETFNLELANSGS